MGQEDDEKCFKMTHKRFLCVTFPSLSLHQLTQHASGRDLPACHSDPSLLRDWPLSSGLGGAGGATWSLLGVSEPVSLIRPPVETLPTHWRHFCTGKYSELN